MLTRRAALAAPLAAWPILPALRAAEAALDATPMGLVIHSFPIHVAADRANGKPATFAEPFRFLEYCHALGAAGIQVSIRALSDIDADALRRKAESASMYLEGIVSLPLEDADATRFEAEVLAAKLAGAHVLRTVMLSGRRYEMFESLEAYTAHAKRAQSALQRAAPIVERHKMLLAVENHKDWHAQELVDLLKRLGSEHVGVCLDTGNNLALLEDPMEVIKTLAPLAFTTHFKDMAVQEYPRGFLLSEVPLGTGVLDLSQAVKTIRAARPDIRFNLEMITRDPLEVPCLEDRYWTSFPDVPATQLARMLSYVRAHAPKDRLPRVSQLDRQAQLRAEDQNVDHCLTYARRLLAR